METAVKQNIPPGLTLSSAISSRCECGGYVLHCFLRHTGKAPEGVEPSMVDLQDAGRKVTLRCPGEMRRHRFRRPDALGWVMVGSGVA